MPDFKFGVNGIKVNVNDKHFDATSEDLELLLDPTGGLVAGPAGLSVGADASAGTYKLTGVNLMATGTTVLVAAVAGKRFIPRDLIVVPRTLTGTVTSAPQIAVGNNSAAFDNVAAASALPSVVVDQVYFDAPLVPRKVIDIGTNAIVLKVTAAVGPSALTADVFLVGVLA